MPMLFLRCENKTFLQYRLLFFYIVDINSMDKNTGRTIQVPNNDISTSRYMDILYRVLLRSNEIVDNWSHCSWLLGAFE